MPIVSPACSRHIQYIECSAFRRPSPGEARAYSHRARTAGVRMELGQPDVLARRREASCGARTAGWRALGERERRAACCVRASRRAETPPHRPAGGEAILPVRMSRESGVRTHSAVGRASTGSVLAWLRMASHGLAWLRMGIGKLARSLPVALGRPWWAVLGLRVSEPPTGCARAEVLPVNFRHRTRGRVLSRAQSASEHSPL